MELGGGGNQFIHTISFFLDHINTLGGGYPIKVGYPVSRSG